jgi:phosphoribosylformimino-5-aminoimidazole carboxamide ribotide isomerase
MLLIPAIDLKDGRCVRLKQGDLGEETVFSEEPEKVARHWLDLGAERIHLVDLNGAVSGKPQNAAVIKAIVESVGSEVPVQLGGGIRSLETIERYLDSGVSYVIIGTAAVKSPGFLHDACNAFPGQVIVGSTHVTARWPPTGGASSRVMKWSIWRASSRATASKRSSTPTSAATAC